MEIIPSARDRRRNVHDFMISYSQLCKLNNVVPNSCISVDVVNNILDFTGERLSVEEWKPVLEAITNDISLHFISIRSRQTKYEAVQKTNNESRISLHTLSTYSKDTISNSVQSTKNKNKERKVFTPKLSPLLTDSLLDSLMEALSTCLSHSQTLTGLLLENINLTSDSLKKLIKGLEVSKSLQQLSLPYTELGDEGCATLSHVLRNRLNLVWLNFTGCNLTDCGIRSLCSFLKFQKLNRYGESWKQSLRSRKVNPSIMPGLRRLTLNHNLIGDVSVKLIAETLIDDFWVIALDFQDCGITSIGGEALLNLVTENQCLSIVDIRGNKEVRSSLLSAVHQKCHGRNTEGFQWLREKVLKHSTSKSNMTINSSRSKQKSKLGSLFSNTQLSVLPNKVNMNISLSNSSSVSHMSTSKFVRNQKPVTPNLPRNLNQAIYSLMRGKSDNTLFSRNKEEIKSNDLPELHMIEQHLHDIFLKRKLSKESRLSLQSKETDLINNRNIENSHNIETVITTLNKGNVIPLAPPFLDCGVQDVTHSKPHMIFETLLSS